MLALAVNGNIRDCSSISLPFEDVSSSSWFSDYVKWAYITGIAQGKSGTTFEPNSYITREESSVLLYRASQKITGLAQIENKNEFKDSDEISPWATEAVLKLQKAAIIDGYDGEFSPRKEIFLSEACNMIVLYKQLNVDSSPDVTEKVMKSDVLDPGNNLRTSEIFSDDYDSLTTNFALAAARNTKNVNYYLDDIDSQIDDYLKDNKDDIINVAEEINISEINSEDVILFNVNSLGQSNIQSSSANANLGTWTAFYSGNYWNSGLTNKTGIATAGYAANSTRARSKNYTAGVGSASSWALTGSSVYISGSGSMYAEISFKGPYAGKMNPGFMGGSAGVRGNLVVKDVSTEAIKSQVAVLNENISVSSTQAYYIPFTRYTTVKLYAGHTYLFYFSVGTSVSNYSPQICWSDFYEPTSPHDWGVRTDYVAISY